MSFASPRHILPAIAAGILLTTAPLYAQKSAGSGDAVTLRLKYKKGEVNKYQTNMAISVAGAGGPGGASGAPGSSGGSMPLEQFSVIQTFETSKLLPSGSAEVIVKTLNMQNGTGASTAGLPKPVTLIMDSRGSVKTAKGSLGSDAPSMFSSILGSNALGTQQVPLPEKSIKPGDVWSTALPISGMGMGSIKGKFVKVEMVGKHKSALLHYILSMPVKVMMNAKNQPTTSPAAAVMTMSGTIIMNIDNDVEIQTGRLIRSSGTGAMLMTLTAKNMPQNTPKQLPPKPGTTAKPPKPGSIQIHTNLTLGTTLIE